MKNTTSLKQITLCADDFALHPAVDAAVVALAQAGRLSATSCMTTAPRWPQAAKLLVPLRPALQVGLHWNLTEGHGQPNTTALSLVQVLARAYSGRIRATAAADSLQRQLDAFEQHTGTRPDFIDGHQHIHQLPGLRAALLQVLRQRYGADAGQAPWVRSTLPARWGANKAAVLALLGGYRLHQMLGRAGLRHNPQFAGVYGFDAPTAEAYGAHMAAWLRSAPTDTLLMCHPANAAVPGDAISAQRIVEYGYLASPAFGELLHGCGAALTQGGDVGLLVQPNLPQRI